MDKLPTPLLENIFKYLHYEQKKKCKVVCRSWARLLQTGLDVETISMANKAEYHAFVKSLRDIGSNCRRLTLIGYPNLLGTAKLFPKIEFIAFTYDDEVEGVKEEVDNIVEYTEEETRQFSIWHQRLETLIDFKRSSMSYRLLKTGRFEKLTTLELRRGDYNFESCEELIKCCKNTPYLKTLKMEQFDFNYNNLNTLHKNASRLQTLVLDNCCLTGRYIPNLLTMAPVYSMKRLDIIGTNDYWNYEEGFCQFILFNYPNLQYLTLPRSKFSSLWKNVIPLMIRSYTLIDLNIPTRIDIPNIVSELKDHAITSLKQLTLGLDYDKTLFVNIMELAVLSNIESLSLVDVPTINFNVFKRLEKLKTLKLKFRVQICYGINPREEWSMEADLNTIVKELPESLEALSLILIKLSLISKTDKDQGKWYHSKLKHLEIHDSDLVDDLSNYLSRFYFPKLNTLVLHYNGMSYPLLLPDQSFSIVDIQANLPYFKVTVGKDKTYININQQLSNLEHLKLNCCRIRPDLSVHLLLLPDRLFSHVDICKLSQDLKMAINDKIHCYERPIEFPVISIRHSFSGHNHPMYCIYKHSSILNEEWVLIFNAKRFRLYCLMDIFS